MYPLCGYDAPGGACDLTPSPAVHAPALVWSERCPEPPPEVDKATARACRLVAGSWSCEAPASSGCVDGHCTWNADVAHTSTWGFFADLPTELPDRRAPTLSNSQVSPNGSSWQDASLPVYSTMPFARVSVQDQGFGVERISGVKVSTDPGPAVLVAGSETLIHFDEGAGLTAAGLGNNLNLTGGTWVAGRHGSAIRLNGAGDQGFFTRNAAFDIGTFTLAAWIKPNISRTRTGPSWPTGAKFRFSIGAHRRLPRMITAAQRPEEYFYVTAPDRLAPGEWHLVAATFDGSFLALFVDGALKGRVPARLSRASTPRFGKSDAFITSFLPAAVDGFRVIGRALSAEELLWDYRRGWSAQYSLDAGTSWRMVPEDKLAFPGAVEGGAGPFSLAAGPLGLPESATANKVAFYSEDLAGNRSSMTLTVKTAVPLPDVLPPVTSLSFAGISSTDGAGGYAVSTATMVGLQASDLPGPGAPASGVAGTFFMLDGVFVDSNTTPLAPFSAPFALAPGAHALRHYSVDRAGNQEPVRLTAVTADDQAPAISIISPLVGGVYSSGASTISIRFTATDDHDPAPRTEAALVQLEDRGAPRGAGPASVTVAAGQDVSPATLDDGLWELRVEARDFAFNSTSAAGGAFEVVHDGLPPRTSLVIGEPRFGAPVFVATYTFLSFHTVDDLAAAGDGAGAVGATYYAVDGGQFGVFTASFTLAADGPRRVSFYSVDQSSNTEAVKVATVTVDATAPATALLVNGQVPGSLTIISTDSVSFAASDGGSGVKETRYALDGGTERIFASSFTLEAGTHTLSYRSQDNMGSLEAGNSAFLTVLQADLTPPALSLVCPGTEAGVCSVFKESFTVRGMVFDKKLAYYRLESGATLISSGTANLDGTLGVWNLAALAGAQTLTLTGVDLAGNAASLTRQVFVGEPARLLVFGSKKDMGQPQGVAVDLVRGVVYAANANKGEIRLYGLNGAYLSKYEDYRHPRSVAVDESGNLYIAESGKDRIVKLGPSGNVLWRKGKTGRGPLEFRDPSGIAALGGKVAVSDTRNRRVQVLDGDGNFQQEFPIPEGSETLVPDDGDEDDEPGDRRGLPVGIALDEPGQDLRGGCKNRKGLAFGPSGENCLSSAGPRFS